MTARRNWNLWEPTGEGWQAQPMGCVLPGAEGSQKAPITKMAADDDWPESPQDQVHGRRSGYTQSLQRPRAEVERGTPPGLTATARGSPGVCE